MSAIVKHIPQAEQGDSHALMRMIETAMQKNDFDVDKLKELLNVKKAWEADEARKAYVSAMAEFKAEPLTITKDKHVAFSGTSYDHASIGNVVGVVCAALGRHGFSHRWDTKQNGSITVTCVITHCLGHSESTTLTAQADDSGKKNAIQQIASTITYLQRYTLLAATGLATSDQEDDDGGGSKKSAEEIEAERVATAKQQEWLDAIRDCTTQADLAKRKKELIDACGGSDKVPQTLIAACIAKKATLA